MKLFTKSLLVILCIMASFTLEVNSKKLDNSQFFTIIERVEKKCGSFEGTYINKAQLPEDISQIITKINSLELDPNEKEFVDQVVKILFPEDKFTQVYNKVKNTLFQGVSIAKDIFNSAASRIKSGFNSLISKKLRNDSEPKETDLKTLLNKIIYQVKKSPKFKKLIEDVENSQNVMNFLDLLEECYGNDKPEHKKLRKGFVKNAISYLGKGITKAAEYGRDTALINLQTLPIQFSFVFFLLFIVLGEAITAANLIHFVYSMVFATSVVAAWYTLSQAILKLSSILTLARKYFSKKKNELNH